MMFMILGIGLFLLPILFRLVLKLRLGIPMLYALLELTVFHGWYQANTALADGIFFVLVGLAALSWVVTMLRHLWELLEDCAKNRGMRISGGEVDTERMAKILLDEFRGGRLGRFTLELPEQREETV